MIDGAREFFVHHIFHKGWKIEGGKGNNREKRGGNAAYTVLQFGRVSASPGKRTRSVDSRLSQEQI